MIKRASDMGEELRPPEFVKVRTKNSSVKGVAKAKHSGKCRTALEKSEFSQESARRQASDSRVRSEELERTACKGTQEHILHGSGISESGGAPGGLDAGERRGLATDVTARERTCRGRTR